MQYPTAFRLLDEYADDLVGQYFQLLGTRVELPIPIRDIAERLLALKCEFEEFDHKLENASAILIPQKRWILVNTKQSHQRSHFGIAHEVAHWLIDCQDTIPSSDGVINIANLKYSSPSRRERLANYLASCLVIPRRLLQQSVQSSAGQISTRQLSREFGVTDTVMRLRLEQLGYPTPIACSAQQRGSDKVLPGLRPDQKQYTLIRPCRSMIDGRLIRSVHQAAQAGSRVYIVLDKDSLFLAESMMGLKDVDGFLLVSGSRALSQLGKEHIKGVELLDFEHHALYYESFTSDRDANRHRFGSVSAYTLDPNRDVDQKQLDIINLGHYLRSARALPSRLDARNYIKLAKCQNKRTVIVTGCFDLITNAHVRFLKRAKAAGDLLLVGIENDARIRAFKGPYRPVNTELQRIEVLEAFQFVDFTFVIHGSPKYEVKPFYTRLHRFLGADILAVSEGDPNMNDRREEIEAAGGRLVVVSKSEDGSTTSILRRFLAETELSDLVFLRTGTLLSWTKREDEDWFQAPLPMDIG
jgi:D-glycero-beta-D-manno-heptose 1-phosphate adenylyltransferase